MISSENWNEFFPAGSFMRSLILQNFCRTVLSENTGGGRERGGLLTKRRGANWRRGQGNLFKRGQLRKKYSIDKDELKICNYKLCNVKTRDELLNYWILKWQFVVSSYTPFKEGHGWFSPLYGKNHNKENLLFKNNQFLQW